MNSSNKKTAKLFKNGHSQAIRLPRNFRFNGDEVNISFHGKAVLLTQISSASSKLPIALNSFDDSFHQQSVSQVIYEP